MKQFYDMAQVIALTGGIMALWAPHTYAVEVADIAIRSEAAIVADNAATDYWPRLEADLKNALIEELAGTSSETGVVMQVTVRELSVARHANATSDDGILATTVMFISGGTAAGALEHTVSVNQQGEDGVGADRVILPRTSDTFYQALLSHYAQTVAQKVRDHN